MTTEPKVRKITIISMIVLLISFVCVQLPFVFTSMRLWRVMADENKVTTYSLEKMYRFYSLRNKTALLPEDALLKIFKISPYLSDSEVNENEQITGKTFLKKTPFTLTYYKTFYKDANIVAYKFIESKKALKIFFEEGGIINQEELKHTDFQKLYDDKFVLNRAIAKSKYVVE